MLCSYKLSYPQERGVAMNQEQSKLCHMRGKNKYNLSEWTLFKQYDIWRVEVNCTTQKRSYTYHLKSVDTFKELLEW